MVPYFDYLSQVSVFLCCSIVHVRWDKQCYIDTHPYHLKLETISESSLKGYNNTIKYEAQICINFSIYNGKQHAGTPL